jgi:hypothetical protein
MFARANGSYLPYHTHLLLRRHPCLHPHPSTRVRLVVCVCVGWHGVGGEAAKIVTFGSAAPPPHRPLPRASCPAQFARVRQAWRALALPVAARELCPSRARVLCVVLPLLPCVCRSGDER